MCVALNVSHLSATRASGPARLSSFNPGQGRLYSGQFRGIQIPSACTQSDTAKPMPRNDSSAHEAAGGRVLVEGQSIGRSKPTSIEFSGRLNVCFG